MINNQTLLSFENVEFNLTDIQNPLLNNINFKLFQGDCLILLGGNGSGKSTFIKSINRAIKATKGVIHFKQLPIQSYKNNEYSKLVTTLSQDLTRSLFYDLTVLENCLLWKLKTNKPSFNNLFQIRTNKEKLHYQQYLQDFHAKLPEKMNTLVRNLSGGEKQALLLALCIEFPPTLLLLDEHTSALDPKQSDSIMHRTYEILKTKQITSIITTHNLDHALAYGNRLIALKQGKICFEANEHEKKLLDRAKLIHYCF